jgi:hypothetical protein
MGGMDRLNLCSFIRVDEYTSAMRHCRSVQSGGLTYIPILATILLFLALKKMEKNYINTLSSRQQCFTANVTTSLAALQNACQLQNTCHLQDTCQLQNTFQLRTLVTFRTLVRWRTLVTFGPLVRCRTLFS